MQAAKRAPVPCPCGHRAVPGSSTCVLTAHPYAAPEEAFARLAREDTEMIPTGLITTHLTQVCRLRIIFRDGREYTTLHGHSATHDNANSSSLCYKIPDYFRSRTPARVLHAAIKVRSSLSTVHPALTTGYGVKQPHRPNITIRCTLQ